MKIFVSHSHAQKDDAARLALALRAAGHEVFLDSDGIAPGGEYNAGLREQLQGSDLVLFIVTADSLRPGSFALTEVQWANERWKNPVGPVLAVRWADPIPAALIPPYLSTTTMPMPKGNKVAETVGYVEAIAEQRRLQAEAAAAAAAAEAAAAAAAVAARRRRLLTAVVAPAVALGLGAALWWISRTPHGAADDTTAATCPLRLTLLAAPAAEGTVELLLAEGQRSFVVTGGTALLDFGGLTRAPASWSLQLMLRGQAPSGRFALQGCPGNGTEVDDGQGNRIRLETRP